MIKDNKKILRLVKLVFLILLSFSRPLATKCISLNCELCMTRFILTDLNPTDLNYFPFFIKQEMSTGSCNTLDDSFKKMCFLRKTKYEFVEVSNMINEQK